MVCLCARACTGWAESEEPEQQHAAEDPSQQIQLRQLSLLGQLNSVRALWPSHAHQVTGPLLSEQRKSLHSGKLNTHLRIHTHYHLPSPSSHPPLFKVLAVVCKIYLCMYLYSIYVLVEYEMWFTAFFFCFEGPFLFISKEDYDTRMRTKY